MTKISSNQKKTANTFSYLWSENKVYENATKKEIKLHLNDSNRRSKGYVRKFLKSYFSKISSKNKIRFLDLGCGYGYTFSIIFNNYITKINYFGIDLISNLKKTKLFLIKRFKKNNFNPTLIKISMNNPKIKKFKPFDLVWAEGSMHHSESIESAIKNVSKIIKRKGFFMFWIINEQKPIRKITDKFFREYYKKISFKDQMNESFQIALLANKFGKQLKDKKIKINKSIKSLGITAGNYRLQEILYDYIIKFFYNKLTTIKRNRNQIFDWFSPRFYHQTNKRNLLRLLNKYKFKISFYHQTTNGHTVIAKKL